MDADVAAALKAARELVERVAGFKVGWDLVLELGLGAVRAVSALGPTVVDVKLADVPHIVQRVVEKLAGAGACCIIAHGFIAPSLRPDPRIYLLLKMTAPSLYDDVWRSLLRAAASFRGVVLPGNQPEAISEARRELGCGVRVISPGIGAQGGRPGDAIRAGADYEIVGRYVLENPERVEEWRSLKPACGNNL